MYSSPQSSFATCEQNSRFRVTWSFRSTPWTDWNLQLEKRKKAMAAGAEGRGGYTHVSVCLMDREVDQAL